MSFTKKQRDAAMIYQNIQPGQNVEADHIKPRSKNGPDDVANLQFIDMNSNRAKSDNSIELREWQAEFLDQWTQSSVESFLCVVIPGGGKTIAALIAAHRFLMAGYDRRVLIVVPTLNLRRQWQVNAEKYFGMKLQTKEFGTDFKSGFVGGVTTYQSLDTSAQLLRKICASAPTLVILDEPHHCRDSNDGTWGIAAKHAFEPAERRLLLSGTPFRTDGLPIPFVRYDGAGVCLTDFRYDYPDALKDYVVRSLAFDYRYGSFDELVEGTRRSIDFNGEMSDEEASESLRQFLNASGDFVAEMIRVAHSKLQEIRRSIPDAAAMAVCMDITHAKSIAQLVKRETGCTATIIVSDEETATGTVEQFRYSRSEWLISVRQVSEGTDIKRLQVLCYLTNASTELIFRQLIGRVSRVRFQDDEDIDIPEEAVQTDLEAFVFLPADPRLIRHAKNIQDAQLRALKEISDDARQQTSRETDFEHSTRIFLGSTHDGIDCVIISGKSYDAVEMAQINKLASYGITMEKAAKIYDGEMAKDHRAIKTADLHQDSQSETTEEEKIDKLRKECNRKAFFLAKLLGCEPSEIHKKWPRQKTMNRMSLENKYNKLIDMIAEVQRDAS